MYRASTWLFILTSVCLGQAPIPAQTAPTSVPTLVAGAHPGPIDHLVAPRTFGPPATVISGCQAITTPGTYVLNTSFAVTATPCLNVHDTGANTSTTIDCQGQTISNATGSGYAVQAINVPNFTLSNCTFVNSTNLYTVWSSGSPNTTFSGLTLHNGNLELFAGSDNSLIANNSLMPGTISVYGGAKNVTVRNNSVNLNGLGPSHPVGIAVADASGSVISSNTVYGDMASHCSTANGSCTDDGIFVESSNGNVVTGVSVQDNTIQGVFDCGIEFTGVSAGISVNDNLISQAGNVGIGGWWGLSIEGGTITNNHVDTSSGLFDFAYFAGNGYSPASTVSFYNVQLTDNILTNAVSTTWVNNFLDFSGYAAAAQNVYGNVLTANDFGGSLNGKIGFSSPSGYSDGGNNVCNSSGPSYPALGFPIRCDAPSSCLEAPNGAFRACYYSNPWLNGAASLFRTDSYPLSFDWGAGAPTCASNLPTLGAACPQQMSATWKGTFPFEAGFYRFVVTVNGAILVSIDGSPIFAQGATADTTYYFGWTFSSPGTHTIGVTYRGAGGSALGAARLSWQKQ